ncbi:MAG: hypothetical protein SYR96_24865 [Actinomycetota bacterium]|nr:hypothetical protein [Actinomycetota bacterium]
MAGSFLNRPRLTKGALVDSSVLAVPPLVVPFQFNPEQVTRQRGAQITSPPSRRGREEALPAGDGPGAAQSVTVVAESISLQVRLDATDALEEGDPVAAEFGVLPALSALELMITPRAETFLGGLLGLSADLGFGDRTSTPVLIFVWGRRVNAVRLTSLSVNEVAYRPNLAPSRVTASLSLQVLPGPNAFHRFVQAERELLAALNLRDAPNLLDSLPNL